MDLKNYLAEFPIDVLERVEVDEPRISIPAKIDSEEFYQLFQSDIDSDTPTSVKSIFISTMTEERPYKTVQSMMLEHVKFA